MHIDNIFIKENIGILSSGGVKEVFGTQFWFSLEDWVFLIQSYLLLWVTVKNPRSFDIDNLDLRFIPEITSFTLVKVDFDWCWDYWLR